MHLGQETLVGHNVTTSSPIYECIVIVLKGDTKVEFIQLANLVGSRTGQSLDDSNASSQSDGSSSSSSNSSSYETYLSKTKHSKKRSDKFLTLDRCINSNFNYESLRSRLTSYTKIKLGKNKKKKAIYQTYLVSITFGVLILK